MQQYHDPIFGSLLEASFRKLNREDKEEKAMRRAARIDNTAKPLRAYAESLGFVVVHLGGAIDCLLCWGSQTFAVDWKSPGGGLTDDQVKLVARGVPLRFISHPAQLDALRSEVTK